MTHCRLWSEDGDREYCRGARCIVSCSGVITSCSRSNFFNAPEHRLELIRKLEGAERTMAAVEPFIQKEEAKNAC
jgi:hypothetical protein